MAKYFITVDFSEGYIITDHPYIDSIEDIQDIDSFFNSYTDEDDCLRDNIELRQAYYNYYNRADLFKVKKANVKDVFTIQVLDWNL